MVDIRKHGGPVHPRDIRKHYPGQHDQLDHGNWADGITGQTRLDVGEAGERPTAFQYLASQGALDEYDLRLLGEYPDEAEYNYQDEVYGNWQTWDGTRKMRRAAMEQVADIEETTLAVDPNQDRPSPHHWSTAHNHEAHAFFALDQVHTGDPSDTLYRAITLGPNEADDFWGIVQEGNEFDAPLLAFATEHKRGHRAFLAEMFGDDVLMVLESGAKGWQAPSADFAPLYAESDERGFLDEVSELMQELTDDEDDDPENREYARDRLDEIEDYRKNPTKTGKEEIEWWAKEYGFTPKWAGYEIDESEDPDAYYEIVDYEGENPHEVISGGRFRVKSIVDDPAGDYGKIVTVTQVGTFDPFSHQLIEKRDVPFLEVESFNRPLVPKKARNILKHMGPGNHPSGSSQDVHSGKWGPKDLEAVGPLPEKKPPSPDLPEAVGGAVPESEWKQYLQDQEGEESYREWKERTGKPRTTPTIQDFQAVRSRWPEEGSHDPELREQTERNIFAINDRMRRDPRWDEAEQQWWGLEEVNDEMDTEIYNQAQTLNEKLWELTNSALGENAYENYFMDSEGYGESHDPWRLSDMLRNAVEIGDPAWGEGTDGLSNGEIIDMVGTGQGVLTTAIQDQTKVWMVVDFEADDGSVTSQPPWDRLFHEDSSDSLGKEGGTVTLIEAHPELGGLLFETTSNIPELPKYLATNLEGGAPKALAGMGPEIIKVPADTLYPESDMGKVIVTPEDFDWDALKALESEWSDFEASYEYNPEDAMALIDNGETIAGKEAMHTDALVVNDTFYGEGVVVAKDVDDVPMILRNLWANTAADEHRWALAVQLAVADEFGLGETQLVERSAAGYSDLDDAKRIYGKFDTALKVWARAVYDHTQEYLTKEGLDVVPVARGQKHNTPPTEEVPIPDRTWTRVKGDLNPLSSWSVDPKMASTFSRGGARYRVVFRGFVPKEQVWGVSLLGNGAVREQEVILLGGIDSFDGQIRVEDTREYNESKFSTFHGYEFSED